MTTNARAGGYLSLLSLLSLPSIGAEGSFLVNSTTYCTALTLRSPLLCAAAVLMIDHVVPSP